MPQSPLNVDQSIHPALTGSARAEIPYPSEADEVTLNVTSHQLMDSLKLETEKNINSTSQRTVSGKGLHVKFIPDGEIYLQRPLTRSIYRSLIIINPNICPVAFKIKTTHPKLYCAYPSAGVVATGKNIHVSVESVPRADEPLMNKRCNHKLLVEITAIIPGQDSSPLNKPSEGARETKITELHKLDVVYIPSEGLTNEDIAEYAAGAARSMPGDPCTVFVGLHKATLPEVEAESPLKDVAHGTLYFRRPLMRSITQSLIILNANCYPIAFKLETKTPEFYLARPNSGKVEPGGKIRVMIQKRPLLEEPPLDKDCKHLFNIATAAITVEQEGIEAKDVIKFAQDSGRAKFYKICVAYIPAEDLMPQDFVQRQNTPGIMFPIPDSKAELQSLVKAKENVDKNFGLESGERMNIFCCPSVGDALCFQRPLTRPISRSLIFTNHNSYTVEYKIKATNPMLYYTRPNSGIVEPGQNVNIAIEKIPLVNEPPLDEECKDQFLLEITPVILEKEAPSINNDIHRGPNHQTKCFLFGVKYIPAEGLPQEELAAYAAGMAHFIPERLFSVYPNTALYFKKPLQNPMNSARYMVMTNIHTRPMVFQILITSQNAAMYAVHPVSGRIESGGHLKIKVVRQPVAKEPLEEADRFCFQCAVINPDQENLELSDIWAATKINKQPLFYQYLPVAVISSKGLTPKEEAIRAQQGIYDRLMKEDTEESAKGSKGNRLGQFAANVGESSAAEPEKFSKVQEASIQKWLLSIPKQC